MIDRRVLLIVCLLSPMLAPLAVSAQGAASPARAVNPAKVKDSVGAKGGVAAHDSASAKHTAKGLDLDKLLVDDDESDLFTEDKPVAPKAHKAAGDSAVAGQAPVDAEGHLAVEGEGAKSVDSVGQGAAPQEPGRRGPPASKTDYEAAAAGGPAVVEEGRTINFAQNLKEYKSPRVAMLLSLLLPGLGQAYARSYIKASAFGAAEVAAIGVAIYLNSVSKSKKKEAYGFADKHFDVNRITAYDSTLRDAFVERSDTVIARDSIPLPYDRYFYDAAGSKSTYYYESIRGKEFTPGWKDYDLSLQMVLDAIAEMNGADKKVIITGTDGNRYKYELYDYTSLDKFYYVKKVSGGDDDWVLGHSDFQDRYNAMIDKSNSYRNAVNYMFYVILLNHIASSIDAGFTARAHNARLLGEDKSAWNRVSVEQRFVFTGSELSPGVSLRLRF